MWFFADFEMISNSTNLQKITHNQLIMIYYKINIKSYQLIGVPNNYLPGCNNRTRAVPKGRHIVWCINQTLCGWAQRAQSDFDSCWQLIWKKFDWNLYVHTKVDTWAEFQLSSLIFIFISCQQLLSAVDSWWQLLRKKFKWDFHLPPKANTCAKFELCRLLGGLARECDDG